MKDHSSKNQLIRPRLLVYPSRSTSLSLTWLKRVVCPLLVMLSAVLVSAQTNNIQQQLEKAASLIRESRITEAEHQLNSILRIAPNEVVALNLLGTVRAQQGKLNEAESLLTRATRLDPMFVPAHMNLALLYLLKHAPEKTIVELKQVIQIEPNNVEANYKLARLMLSQGQIDEAINTLEKAKMEQPSVGAFLTLLGDAYLRKNNAHEAETNYLGALGAQKNNTDAMLGLARVAQLKGDSKTGLTYLSQAKDLLGNSPEMLYKFGVAALGFAVYDEAQIALEQAVKLKSDEPSYLIALGATLLKRTDLFAAEQLFRRALDLQPDNSQGQMYLGYVLYKQKRFPEAKTHLEKTIKAGSSVPEPFYYLGLILQEENEDERAITLLERAIKLSPSFANAHVALGASYLKLKNYPQAQEKLELGVKLNPDDSKAHYQLAVLYARLKDPKRAQAEMQIVERLKSVDLSQKREGDTFVITPPNP
ncbi:MAG: tetratricopeptide repeat protein [Pyrinomonadaceae bacterium]